MTFPHIWPSRNHFHGGLVEHVAIAIATLALCASVLAVVALGVFGFYVAFTSIRCAI